MPETKRIAACYVDNSVAYYFLDLREIIYYLKVLNVESQTLHENMSSLLK